MSKIAALFTDHPGTVDESYFEHLAFASWIGGMALLAALAAFAHALLPFAFDHTASRIITRLNDTCTDRAKPWPATVVQAATEV